MSKMITNSECYLPVKSRKRIRSGDTYVIIKRH